MCSCWHALVEALEGGSGGRLTCRFLSRSISACPMVRTQHCRAGSRQGCGTSIILCSLFGRSASRICLTATASPVLQLKALYTDPKAPLPMQSPRRCTSCGQPAMSQSGQRRAHVVLQTRILHGAHAIAAVTCLLSRRPRDLGRYHLAVGVVVGPVGRAAGRHVVPGAVPLMGAVAPPCFFFSFSASYLGRRPDRRSFQVERTLPVSRGHGGSWSSTGEGHRQARSPSHSSPRSSKLPEG